ncbi:hypothetical protein [Lyngbya sp. PCC 8106]|uniref:hypothetical protein n=1 Tax=Lyngbya sp. (strain PCC 8106) TaxID=313612 RepID=UPI0000EAB0AD|nr:hypothetical protein [Lyngbya sp. PCC 8106]EAW39155.1 hypothetical protein L8106_04416 [Lyngbya sp. PCC 8106]
MGDQPGNFENKSGEAVYRQSGLGERGLIFRMPEESVYIYWDTAPFEADKSESNSTAYTPKTYTTVQNSDEIAIQITEG